MLIKALDRADAKQREELNRWLDAETCQSAEKIKAVTELYNQLDIRSVCENKMRGYYTLAMKALPQWEWLRKEKRTEEPGEIVNVP